jgi:hypothetical protein
LITDTPPYLLHIYAHKRQRLELSISTILVMSSNVASNKRKEAAVSLNDDMPRNYDATPVIPINLISHLILPFLPDRQTWNAVCSANKELHEASMIMTPPSWPATKLILGQRVGALKFSPCGHTAQYGSTIINAKPLSSSGKIHPATNLVHKVVALVDFFSIASGI